MLLTAFAPSTAFAQASSIFFPDDAGVINVHDFGAVGDGITDDTAAINAALSAFNGSTSPSNVRPWTIYFPEGEYLVSDTIAPTVPGIDHPLNGVRLVGQNRDTTTIRLMDNASGFDDARDPKFVVRTGSRFGQGNSGYSNYVQNLTVHTGAGNVGAGGIHYDVANIGAIQDVRITSGSANGSGSYGLGIFSTSGQGYVKRVEIEGFNHGVHVENTVNNIVFEDIELTNQRDAAIFNQGKILSFKGLTTRGSAPILETQRALAATYLLDVKAHGSGGAAFDMQVPSYLYMRDASITGYGNGVDVGQGGANFEVPLGQVDEWWSHGEPASPWNQSLRLPVKDAPEFHPHENTVWVSVQDFGATADDGTNDATAIQDALDFAARQEGDVVVYFPFGSYTINDDVVVRDGVRMVDFMHSEIDSDNGRARFFIRQSEGEVANIENVRNNMRIVHGSDGTVAIRNISSDNSSNSEIRTSSSATGDFFVENAGPHAEISINNDLDAWLRAINREKSPFTNDGGTVWFYGDNIETMIRVNGSTRIQPILTENGGVTEYIAGTLDPLDAVHTLADGPLFITVDATLSAIAAGQVRDGDGGDAYWPYIARYIVDGEQYDLFDEDTLRFIESPGQWPQRWVLPLYTVGDFPSPIADMAHSGVLPEPTSLATLVLTGQLFLMRRRRNAGSSPT